MAVNKEVSLDDVFGDNGLLKKAFDWYSIRPQQITMTEAVERVMKKHGNILIEAPTGVGKSFGYSIPAILNIKKFGSKVVIATPRIALQEQLVEKDLPLLQQVFKDVHEFSFGLLKGRNNYLCLRRFNAETTSIDGTEMYRDSSGRGRNPEDIANEEAEFEKIIEWQKETKAGDVSELNFVPCHNVWKKVAGDSDSCEGSECDFRDVCYYQTAKEYALACDIIVTNYHVLFAHYEIISKIKKSLLEQAQKLEENLLIAGDPEVHEKLKKVRDSLEGEKYAIGKGILPVISHLICDEAHKAPDVVRGFVGYGVTQFAVSAVATALEKTGHHGESETLRRVSKGFFDEVYRYSNSDEYDKILLKKNFVNFEPILGQLKLAVAALKSERGVVTEDKDKIYLDDMITRAKNVLDRLKRIKDFKDEGFVYWIEKTYKKISLKAQPVDVSGYLREWVFQKPNSVIITSATLDSGDYFEFISNQMGADDAELLQVGSPFNFKENVMLVCPDISAEINSDEFSKEIGAHILKIIESVGGRTLGLFTSYKNLNAVFDIVAPRWRDTLRQGDGALTKLIDEFRMRENSVLLGTDSCWGGIDVPGSSLSCVIIDRLPFTHRGDPVYAWLSEHRSFNEYFYGYMVPKAVMQFKQGFGRLVRRQGDVGVVVVFDNRLSNPGVKHRQNFMDAIPTCILSRNPNNIPLFLQKKGVDLSVKDELQQEVFQGEEEYGVDEFDDNDPFAEDF